jgi:hypothetical protein
MIINLKTAKTLGINSDCASRYSAGQMSNLRAIASAFLLPTLR